MIRFRLTTLLVLITVAAIAIFASLQVLERRAFEVSRQHTWGNIDAGYQLQGEAVRSAIENMNFGNRHKASFAFCGIARGSEERVVLWADWVVAKNRIDGIRIRLNSGKIVNSSLADIYGSGNARNFYFNGGILLGSLGLHDPKEIEAVSLTSQGNVVTKWLRPTEPELKNAG